MSSAVVTDGDVEELYLDGAVLLLDALRYVFSPDDELQAIAAIAARLLDERAVCLFGGPHGSQFCEGVPYQNGMLGVAVQSASSCERCDSSIGIAEEMQDYATTRLNKAAASGERPTSGDVLAFLGGPSIPEWQPSARVWWFAPTPLYDDSYAVYIDPLFDTRKPTPKTSLVDHAQNALVAAHIEGSEGACKVGPLCWMHEHTACMCGLRPG